MLTNNPLKRFLDAQNQMYLNALAEIKNGQKTSHWMWFIFPQIHGLGQSETAKFYAIANLDEAEAYLFHPVLGQHLIQISSELLRFEGKTAHEIFGYPDDLKLRSSMTLFANVDGADMIFSQVLDKYFDGIQDDHTVRLLEKWHV